MVTNECWEIGKISELFLLVQFLCILAKKRFAFALHYQRAPQYQSFQSPLSTLFTRNQTNQYLNLPKLITPIA